jgi:hypothetical protein
LNLELGVFPERTQLSASSHRIDFVKDGEPRLVVQLPWPVLVDGIKLSLIKRTEKQHDSSQDEEVF